MLSSFHKIRFLLNCCHLTAEKLLKSRFVSYKLYIEKLYCASWNPGSGSWLVQPKREPGKHFLKVLEWTTKANIFLFFFFSIFFQFNFLPFQRFFYQRITTLSGKEKALFYLRSTLFCLVFQIKKHLMLHYQYKILKPPCRSNSIKYNFEMCENAGFPFLKN